MTSPETERYDRALFQLLQGDTCFFDGGQAFKHSAHPCNIAIRLYALFETASDEGKCSTARSLAIQTINSYQQTCLNDNFLN